MIVRWMTAWVLLAFSASVWAISPYIQGDSVSGGNVQAAATAVEAKLKSGGFKVVGKYFPRDLRGMGVVIATDEAMLGEVGSVGGNAIMGAAIRVGVKANGSVAYTNPDYWYRAYFRKSFDKKEGAVKALQERLKDALGGQGPGRGRSARQPDQLPLHDRHGAPGFAEEQAGRIWQFCRGVENSARKFWPKARAKRARSMKSSCLTASWPCSGCR